MKLAVHLLISAQLIAWTIYMGFAYLAPDDKLPTQSVEGYLFLCITGVILCFFPALRMARTYERQPFALALASLPVIAVIAILIVQFL